MICRCVFLLLLVYFDELVLVCACAYFSIYNFIEWNIFIEDKVKYSDLAENFNNQMKLSLIDNG